MLFWIGIAGATVLVVAWLFVSFLAPGHARSILAWLGAVGLYTAFLCFFLSLTRGALANEQYVRLCAFGLLTLIFCSGLGISSFRLLREIAGGSESTQASATN